MGKCQTTSSFILSVIALIAVDAHDAAAQAWVGDKGSLDVGFDYNFAFSSKVIGDGDVEDFPDAGTNSHQLMVSAEYAPIRNLAVSFQLPLLMTKYTGEVDPNTGRPAVPAYDHCNIAPSPCTIGTYDDGDFHTTLTDLRAGARYQVLDEPVAIAPHVAFSIPVADYETVGNVVGGRHLKMLHVGAGIGYLIGDKSYTHLLYEFTLAEKYGDVDSVTQHSQNRSDLAFIIGTKLLDYRLDLHADVNVRRTHGGLGFSALLSATPEEVAVHDAILDEDVLLVGGGIGYQLSDALAVSLSGRAFVAGQNTLNANVLALGLAWSPIQ